MSNENFATQVYPFLKQRYFDNIDENYLFKVVQKYQGKYGNFPSFNEVNVLIQKNPDDEDRLRLEKILGKIEHETDLENDNFLLDETEEYIRNKDLQLSIVDSVEILQKEDKTLTASIPSLIEDSLSISFDKTIGLNFSNSMQQRLDYYKAHQESGFKCDIDIINKLTNGGFKRKTFTTLVGAPHSGKTLFLTHLATSFITNGHNVLYITLEMDEREIAKRIDANLLNHDINELKNADNDDFINSYKNLYDGGLGELVIKEYPTASANAIHFKALIKELAQKQKFKPDVILIDYLGIMGAVSDNMYDNIKRNAEALRAIAVEFDCAVMTGSQTNRQGFDRNNGIAMSDIAESTGPLQISDCVLGISKFESGVEEDGSTEDDGFKKVMEQLILVNVLKNRMGGLTSDKFLLKQKFRYMRLEEVNNTTTQKTSEDSKKFVDAINSTSNEPIAENFKF